tara:strand:- start:238 stop:540 length:303 start_codon:yes stop_codon:yes gene_type:complete
MQLFVRLCNNRLLSYYDETNKKSLCALKKFVFKKSKIPRTWQRFVFNGKTFFDDNIKYEDIPLYNDSTLEMHLKWHGTGCLCDSCLEKGMLLRNGKRLKI